MSMTTPPMSMTILPFCHEWQKASTSSRHLIITGWASTITLISIIVVGVIVIILGFRGRMRGGHSETTYDSLSLCDTTNTGVHLSQLITESVKTSIHVHKLCHDGLKCHSTHRGKGSGGGWSWRSRRSCYLGLCPPRAKLSITPSNSSCVNGTHDEEVIRRRIRGRKIAKNPHDSWRKDEFITGRRIPIEIYKGKDKVRRKINRKILNEG